MSAVKNKSAEAAARASKRTPPAEAASDPGLIAKDARAAAKRARREAREADATKTAAAAESAVIADSEKAAVPPAEAMCNESDAEVKASFEENDAASDSMAAAHIADSEEAVPPSAEAADPKLVPAQPAAASAGPAPATTPVGITPALKAALELDQYRVKEADVAAILQAGTDRDLDPNVRKRAEYGLAKAMKRPDFPARIITESNEGKHTKGGGTGSRLRILQAYAADPSCASMYISESRMQSTDAYWDIRYVMRTRDDMEKEWQCLGPERAAAKVDLLIKTARTESVSPLTGETMYEVHGETNRGQSGRDRKACGFNVSGQVAAESAAIVQDILAKDEQPAIEDDKASMALAKAKAKAKAKAEGPHAPGKKTFVHPAIKRQQVLQKKLTLASKMRHEIANMAEASSAGPSISAKTAVSMFDNLASKGDEASASLTNAYRAHPDKLDTETWPVTEKLTEETERMAFEALEFGKNTLKAMKKAKA